MDQNKIPSADRYDSNRLNVVQGLSAKLLLLTVVFIMLAEVLIFIPSIANFRNVWLRTHLDIAEAASIVYLDASDQTLSDTAAGRLLETTKSNTIAIRKDGISQLIASQKPPNDMVEHINLDQSTAFGSMRSAVSMLFGNPNERYRVFGSIRSGEAELELVQEMEHIQNAMWLYARNILVFVPVHLRLRCRACLSGTLSPDRIADHSHFRKHGSFSLRHRKIPHAFMFQPIGRTRSALPKIALSLFNWICRILFDKSNDLQTSAWRYPR